MNHHGSPKSNRPVTVAERLEWARNEVERVAGLLVACDPHDVGLYVATLRARYRELDALRHASGMHRPKDLPLPVIMHDEPAPEPALTRDYSSPHVAAYFYGPPGSPFNTDGAFDIRRPPSALVKSPAQDDPPKRRQGRPKDSEYPLRCPNCQRGIRMEGQHWTGEKYMCQTRPGGR